jgi:hypothetical protein
VVEKHLDAFLTEAKERSPDGDGLPRFVEQEFRNYLGCGILSRGFCRVVCSSCGDEKVVGFSCKGRGFCPSCGARRMFDIAAHLVENVQTQCASCYGSVRRRSFSMTAPTLIA